MEKFKKRKLIWFTNRIGKTLSREATVKTSEEDKLKLSLSPTIYVLNESLAKVLYDHHIKQEVNYNDF